MNRTKIMIMGDVHAEFGAMNSVLQKHKPDIILQCGDFGYWPKFKLKSYPKIPISSKLYFCDGNHEDHWSLLRIEKNKTSNEVFSNCFYMKRGSVLELPDGRKVLFMGGAESIDKYHRTIGIDWFPEETISISDINSLPDEDIDIIISHACPTDFEFKTDYKLKCNDPSRKALDYVFDKYKPSLWYFGHWHRYMVGNINKCKWIGLNYARWTNWWVWL